MTDEELIKQIDLLLNEIADTEIIQHHNDLMVSVRNKIAELCKAHYSDSSILNER